MLKANSFTNVIHYYGSTVSHVIYHLSRILSPPSLLLFTLPCPFFFYGRFLRGMAAARVVSESAVYDRQIRLWGLEAQKRMQESKVLFVGFGALQAEVRDGIGVRHCCFSYASFWVLRTFTYESTRAFFERGFKLMPCVYEGMQEHSPRGLQRNIAGRQSGYPPGPWKPILPKTRAYRAKGIGDTL